MSEELPTVAVGYNDDHTVDFTRYQTFLCPHTEFGEKMLRGFKDVGRDHDELVRRQDVVELIDRKLDQVYEDENNASAEQEIATSEMLMKILEIVKEKDAEGGEND